MSVQTNARTIAKELRQNQTEAEKIFWTKIRKKRILGLKFLRQHPVYYRYSGRLRYFIADFYCHEKKLIVEVDGGIHEKQKEYDKKRTEILRAKEYSVYRIRNEEIFNNIDGVIMELRRKIENGLL